MSAESCPIDVDTKQWIDARASWILQQFGRERILDGAVVVPTAEFFPVSFRESEADVQLLLERLCTYLDIDAESVHLAFYYEGERADGGATAAGLFEDLGEQFRIWIEYSELHDPASLAATMVHELCHVHLLGHGRLTSEEDDHEPLTDLLAIFLGLGVILANAVLRDSTRRLGNFEHWRIQRKGYLSMPMCGYALALFSMIRGEQRPKWETHLRPDVRDAFKKSLKYLRRHGLPELQSVITTTARPTLYSSERGHDENQDLDPSTPEQEESNGTCCQYCGASLAGESSFPVCADCQVSIDENQGEIEVDRQAEEAAWRTKRIVVRYGCLFFVVVIGLLSLLDWLVLGSELSEPRSMPCDVGTPGEG